MNRNEIPEDTKDTLQMWATKGYQPGGFLSAVLENDLFKAVERADDRHLACLPGIVIYIWNNLPLGCWGSREKMKEWQEYLRNG